MMAEKNARNDENREDEPEEHLFLVFKSSLFNLC